MKMILQLNASILSDNGQSSRLANEFAAALRRDAPEAKLILRDFARDTLTAYVRDFFAFLGITDVEFVYAEGLAISETSRNAALAKARAEIERLVPAFA